jgi:DNA-binding transcriptional ArsR family regulator
LSSCEEITRSISPYPSACSAVKYAGDARGELRAGGGLSDEIGPVFAALADPTRRFVVQELLRDGSTTVPALTAALPITRQAVAKHLAALDEAGLIERAPGAGREVRYRLPTTRCRRRRRGCAMRRTPGSDVWSASRGRSSGAAERRVRG